MGRTILMTVGVSLLQHEVAEKESLDVGFEALGSAWDPRLTELEAALRVEDRQTFKTGARPATGFNVQAQRWVRARQGMVRALESLGRQADQEQGEAQRAGLRHMGAELASLKRLEQGGDGPLDGSDRVILLASDTVPGIFVAYVIRDLLVQGQGGFASPAAVEVRPVEGLRPDNAEAFLAQGLPGVARILFEEYDEDNSRLIVTGGYKGLLPYLGPVAMVLGIPLLYLYEESETLLEIRPLPVSFDLGPVSRNLAIFDELASVGYERNPVTKSAFLARIPREFLPATERLELVEYREGPGETLVHLTPTGRLAHLLAKSRQIVDSPREQGRRP